MEERGGKGEKASKREKSEKKNARSSRSSGLRKESEESQCFFFLPLEIRKKRLYFSFKKKRPFSRSLDFHLFQERPSR